MINRAGQIFEVKSTKSIILVVSSEPLPYNDSRDADQSTRHNYIMVHPKGFAKVELILRQGIEDHCDSWESHNLLTRIG